MLGPEHLKLKGDRVDGQTVLARVVLRQHRGRGVHM
jgi:hypothetical protein